MGVTKLKSLMGILVPRGLPMVVFGAGEVPVCLHLAVLSHFLSHDTIYSILQGERP